MKLNKYINIIAAFLTTGCISNKQAINYQNQNDISSKSEDVSNKDQITIYKQDSTELEKQLDLLANKPYEGQLQMGAMCYSPAPPQPVSYSCPICKEKVSTSQYYKGTLSSINEIVNKIKAMGYDCLIECHHEQDSIIGAMYTETNIVFKMRFSQSNKYHIAINPSAEDFKALLAFLENKETYFGVQGQEHSLHDNIQRIKNMTGLEPNQIPNEH